MQGPVRRRVGGVGKKWLAAGAVALDIGNQPVGKKRRGVVIFRQGIGLAVVHKGRPGFCALYAGVVEVAGTAFQDVQGFVETAVLGQGVAPGGEIGRAVAIEPLEIRRGAFGNMPFTGHIGVITAVLQQRGNGHHMPAQVRFIARLPALARRFETEHGAEARAVIVGAREQHGASRRTGRRHVKTAEQLAGSGQAIQVGRLYLAAHNAQVRVAQIIGQQNQYIGARSIRG